MRGFFTALAFFSRINLFSASQGNFAAALAWSFPAALFLGILCALFAMSGAFFLAKNSVLPYCALFGGLFWLIGEIWLSRGLHWDGVADLADALGSGAQGEKFWHIIRDSRIGAFGVMALLALFIFQWLAASAHILSAELEGGGAGQWLFSAYLPLILAVAWGRLAPFLLASKSRMHALSNLGAMWGQNCGHGMRLMAYGLLAVYAFLPCFWGMPIIQAVALLFLQICLNGYYIKMARAHGGFSGDFFGSAIETGQALYLFMTIY